MKLINFKTTIAMRVMCISKIPTKCYNSDRVVEVPLYGEIDIAIDHRIFEGRDVYILERFGKSVGFHAHHFIPLSEIDEVELIKERQEYETLTQ